MSSEPSTVQTSITGFWNQVAPHYEGGPGNTAALGSDLDRLWADLIARVLPPPPADVLDLGTGTGFVALHAAALGHRVVGIDLARDMLAVARQQAVERDLQVRFEEGDAVDPPFEPGASSCLTASGTIRSPVARLIPMIFSAVAGFFDVQLDPLPRRFVEDADVAVRPYIIVAARGHAALGGTHTEVRMTSR